MHMHIKFLLVAGDDLQTKIICPFCKTETIKYFLLLNNNFIHKNLTCCANDKCRKELKLGHGDDMLVALKVRNLGMRLLKTKTLRRKAEMLFRQALSLKPKSSPQAIFDAVSAKYLGYFTEALGEADIPKKEEVKKEEPSLVKEATPSLRKEPLPLRNRSFKKRSCSEKQLSLAF